MTSLIELPVPLGRAVPGTLVGDPPVGGPAPEPAPPPSRGAAFASSRWPWLGLVAVLQVVATRVLPSHDAAFQDEGLYIYMGHRLIDSLTGGTPLFEFPGSYFSGAPAFYPVLAAVADSLGGLTAARDLSLVMIIVTMVATAGITEALFGRLAGVLGGLAFALCGSVVYVSHWATFDAMAMMLAALAAWLATVSAKRDGLLFAPVVGVVLFLAIFAKYAGAMYLPVVAALAVAVGWRTWGWRVVRRAVFLQVTTVTVFFFVILLWGRGLLPGLAQTTTERHILNPASATHLAGQVAAWVGPWLALALVGGALRLRSHPVLVCVLLGASVLAPLQQIHIGEATSLRKHVAFGMVFACVLVGDLLARMTRTRFLVPVVATVLVALAVQGAERGGDFLTAYPDDTAMQTVLREAVAANPGKPILAEQSSAQRYELMDVTQPRQWNDTYVFNYDGLTGTQAYQRAIDDHYFGVIYLNFTTAESHKIVKMLSQGAPQDRYYHLVGQVPGYIHDEKVGYWLVWTPQTRRYTAVR